MKRNYKVLLLVVLLAVALWSFIPRAPKSDPEKDKMLIELLTFVIERGHYNPAAIDDEFSKGVYKEYIAALDPSKRFFLQADIDEFAPYETQIDDQIRNKDLRFFTLTYERLMQRIDESKSFYSEILSKPFDYSVEETFNNDYEKLPYAKTSAELYDRWRKQIKLSTLSSLTDKLEMQEDLKKGIKPADKKSADQDGLDNKIKIAEETPAKTLPELRFLRHTCIRYAAARRVLY